jgi:uncharacterized protein YjbI with pentapeptide repeats
MANQQHLDILFRGVRNWNEWREANSSEWSEWPDFSGANLEKLNLAGVNLRRASFDDLNGGFNIGADLTHTNLNHAELTKADLTGANLTGANLRGANLNHAELEDADLTDADLTGANLTRAHLSYAKMDNANFSKANLSETSFCWVDLGSVNLTGAKLTKVNFFRSDLTGLDLSGVDLDDAELSEANLSGANLSNASICNRSMRNINLSGANLTGAKLIGARLGGANLTGANLTSANLVSAILGSTNLSDADLTDAVLGGTEFSGACLRGANLSGSHMKLTVFANIDLRNVKGLESVNHQGPSTIGADTLSRSGGNIPEIFLRGAGVSDDLITYTVSLAKKPIKHYNCVISYSKQDQEFAECLYNGLQQRGVRCWYAPEGMTTGPYRSRVVDAFDIYDKLLLILSQHSIHAYWTTQAAKETLSREGNNHTPILFPIRLDNTILGEERKRSFLGQVLFAEPSRDIADFTEWIFQISFQEAIDRLVVNLQSSTSPA